MIPVLRRGGPGPGPEPEEDAWGHDPAFARGARPALDLLYDRWWRVRAHGGEHVPAHGRAVVLANHAGVLPYDAAMIATAIGRAPAGRQARALLPPAAFDLPWANVAARRLGAVAASKANALGLLAEDHVVIGFPETGRAVVKPYADRYRLERFGRGEAVEVALRAQAPIVPCAVVGSEEVHPVLTDVPILARVLRTPAFPITPTFPLLGPLGLLPLPSRWHIAFGAPIHLRHPPAAAEDRALVLSINDRVRDTVQHLLHETLLRRKAAFL